MATHYEVLGVRPQASHEEIKRAYTELALRFHPDRQDDAGEAALQRAEFRMREINAAWQVLRSPAARAGYDRDLAGAAGLSGPRDRSASRSPATDLPDLEPIRSRLVVPVEHANWWRFAPVILIVVVLGTILVFTAYATKRDGSPSDPGVQVKTSPGFQAGGCVVFASADGRIMPIEADCSTAGASRITLTTDLGRPCPSGQSSFDIQADKMRLCLVG